MMRGMFGPMVGPSVLKFMEENPESVGLTGARKTATILFSDVAGFTTISEKLSPSDLSAVLNVYLTPMTNIIMTYDGMIDKYEGDAIMANFGVPVWEKEDPESHAWKCLPLCNRANGKAGGAQQGCTKNGLRFRLWVSDLGSTRERFLPVTWVQIRDFNIRSWGIPSTRLPGLSPGARYSGFQ